MKKIRKLILLLCCPIFLITTAYGEGTPRACNHPNMIHQTRVEYESQNASSHSVTTLAVVWCPDCKRDIKYTVIDETLVPHSVTLQSNHHVGSQHVYEYACICGYGHYSQIISCSGPPCPLPYLLNH